MPQANAEHRHAGFRQRLIIGTAYSPVAAGSPGPFDRNTPSACWRRISSAVAVAGTTVTCSRPRRGSAECCAWRRKSTATTCAWRVLRRHSLRPAPACLRPAIVLGAGHLFGEVHAFQAGPGAWLRRGRRSSCPGSWQMTPVWGPPSRISRVRRRVSTPAMPTGCGDFSQASRWLHAASWTGR